MNTINAHELKTPANIAIVVSQFNTKISSALLQGALARLQERQIDADKILVVEVPGAIEIPVVAQRLARTQNYEAVICLGAVIRGDTDHYDYVCQQVSYGCQKVALECNLPIIFGILTTDTEKQARERVGGKDGHKGRDAADTALAMISIMRHI